MNIFPKITKSLLLGIFFVSAFLSLFALNHIMLFAQDNQNNQKSQELPIPENWNAEWQNPSNEMRPLQIIHGRNVAESDAAYYRDQCGLGGLVINVGGAGYVRNDENWKRFVETFKTIRNAGLRVWIYDEEGYPSLSAGGAVLEGHPELDSLELVYDSEAESPFYVRDCYEFAHASNNVCAARRYPNPLDIRAVQRFIELTHQRYKQELGDELYHQAEAFFTDEPSLMAVDLGAIQDDIRERVPVRDPLDPNKKNLPRVPWVNDLEERYFEKYQEELRPHFISLFQGDSETDRQIRRQFWTLISELNRERFYQPIQDFCHSDPKGPVASGHTLYEEDVLIHIPLDGNKLEALKTFDLPGLDMLNSDPMAFHYGAWVAAAFPCSAATLIGERRTMSEVSDFSQLNSGDRKPVSLEKMEATAAWHCAWGVTEFTLYYGIKYGDAASWRNEESHKKYCEFVGRINAILRDATPVRPVLLYYPVEGLQEEYQPVAEKISQQKQSPKLQELAGSFHRIGTSLGQCQIPFTIIDRESLAPLLQGNADSTKSETSRQLDLSQFKGIIFPRHVAQESFAWKDPSFKEVWVDSKEPISTPAEIRDAVESFAGPHLKFNPPNDHLIAGTFERDGRLIYLLSNPTENVYEGIAAPAGNIANHSYKEGEWTLLNPQNGEISRIQVSKSDNSQQNDAVQFSVRLEPYSTFLFVEP